MNGESENVPWICHICGEKSSIGVGKACALCFKIACDVHLRHMPLKSEKFGNLELKLVCTGCSEDIEGKRGKPADEI